MALLPFLEIRNYHVEKMELGFYMDFAFFLGPLDVVFHSYHRRLQVVYKKLASTEFQYECI